MVNMKYRGFTSVFSYCANRSEKEKEGGVCPKLRFAFDNVISPNSSDSSRKRQYANVIQFLSRSVIGRVALCPKR